MSKPDWVGEDAGKLLLWGAAVRLQIPAELLSHEESTRGFVEQPLGGKDKILIPWHSNRLSIAIPFLPTHSSSHSAPNSAPQSYLPVGCHSELSYPCLQAQQVGVGLNPIHDSCMLFLSQVWSMRWGATLFTSYWLMSHLSYLSFSMALLCTSQWHLHIGCHSELSFCTCRRSR